jgi:hypothetical protein
MKKLMVMAFVIIAALVMAVVPAGAYVVTQEDIAGAPGAEVFDQPGFVWQITEEQALMLPSDICLNLGDGKDNTPYSPMIGRDTQDMLRMKMFYFNYFTGHLSGSGTQTFYYAPIDNYWGLIPPGASGSDVVPIF